MAGGLNRLGPDSSIHSSFQMCIDLPKGSKKQSTRDCWTRLQCQSPLARTLARVLDMKLLFMINPQVLCFYIWHRHGVSNPFVLGAHACCEIPTHTRTHIYKHSIDLQVRDLCALLVCECSCLLFTGKMRMTTRNPCDELHAAGERDPLCRKLHHRISSLYRGLGFRV